MDSQNRFLIAVVFSVLILLVFQMLYPAQRARKYSTQPNIETEQKQTENNRIITVSSEKKSREELEYLENEVFKIELTNNGARIKQIWLKKFKDPTTSMPTQLLNSKTTEGLFTGPFLLEDASAENLTLPAIDSGRRLPLSLAGWAAAAQNWQLVDKSGKSVKYSYKNKNGVLITKEIFLPNSNYIIGLRITTENTTSLATLVKYKLVGPSSLYIKPGMDERFIGADIEMGQEVTRQDNPRKILKSGEKIYYNSPSWLSIRGRYFSLALEPKQQQQACFIEPEGQKGVRSGVIIGPETIQPNTTLNNEFLLYAGPNDIDELKKASPNLIAVVTYGKLSAICVILNRLLRFFNRAINSYGISIILLTLAINAVLFPLTKKSLGSMKQMQAMQPEIERLRAEHKDKPQKMNKEIMELYKRHKVNPLGGCLPMVFQMPVFIALYLVLIKSIELKGAKFLWIKDLSEPDAFLKLPATLPILGDSLNILPILTIVAMFLQQKISQPAAAQTEQQKAMAMIMPVFLGFIFYNLPSGFILYWLTNTILLVIIQQILQKTPAPAANPQ